MRLLKFFVSTLVVGFLCLGLVGSASAQRMHSVKRGDSWAKVARRYHVSATNLAMANGRTPRSGLRAGEDLVVPSRFVTFVRRGQTLSRIARAHDTTVDELKRLNRKRLKGGLRAGAQLILPGHDRSAAGKGRDYGEPEHPGHVTLTVRDQRATIRLVDDEGRVLEAGLRKLAEWMHPDPLQAAGGPMPHPRLALLLARISDHFGGRPIQVFSGFRQARGRTTETSRHVAGRAVDIMVGGVSKRTLFEFCRSLGNTGCGFYPRSLFVHVDAREAPAQWVDWSRPGRRSRYGTMRRPYRRRERRNPNRPRESRRVTRPDAVPLEIEVVNTVGRVYRVDDRPQMPLEDAEVVQQHSAELLQESVM